MLRTATDLLVEAGPSAVTIDAIVARSGVARSTIYRHWESRQDVLLAVIEGCAPHIDPPEASLGFDAALRLLMARLAEVLNDPDWARVLPALFALRNQEHGIAQLEQRLEDRQARVLEQVLDQGVAEGGLDPSVDVDLAESLLVGPLVFATLRGRPIDAPLVDHLVDVFLRTSGTASGS